MITKDEIKKLKGKLKRGDQTSIAEMAGLSRMQVGNFFNGNEDLVSDESASMIIEQAAKLIKNRSNLSKQSSRIIKNI